MAPLLAEALAREGFRAEAAPWQGMARETLPEAVQLLWVVLPDDPFPGGLTPEPVSRFLAEHPKTVVVAAREPYCLASYPETALRLAAWGGQPPHLRAVARWLAGYNKKG
jgi:hypothetical protein